MRTSFRLVVAVCALVASVAGAALVAPSVARADGMDVTLSRLSLENQSIGINPDGSARCICNCASSRCQDDGSWDALLQQLAVSMAPPILAPAASLGPGRFSMGYEAWMTTIASDRPFWQLGTEGRASDTSGTNRFTSSPLYWHRISVRMAFPFGFQLGTNVGQLIGTSYFTAGVEVQWSIFEGFRRWGWLPDIAVRGAVQVLFGETEFDLTVPTVDVVISKSITLGNIGTLTPFIAGQLLFILGDSELVDLTPGCDSHVALASAGACPPSPVGPNNDSFNNAVYAQIRKNRGRGVVGFQLRFSWFMLTGSFAFDVTNAVLEMPQDGFPSTRGLPAQFTVSFGASATF